MYIIAFHMSLEGYSKYENLGVKRQCIKRITRAFEDSKIIQIKDTDRFVFFSDCHRGTGMSYDNYMRNQHLFFAAIKHYYAEDYYYIELGDGEELWENRSYDKIKECHSNVYWMFEEFHKKDKILRLYGNHNMVLKKHLHETAFLINDKDNIRICLMHGHQIDFLNSTLWRLSRFLVRYVWRVAERMGFSDPTSAASNYDRRTRLEREFIRCAKALDMYIICGHTHKPSLQVGSRYCNTGSCVHPRCITCIELDSYRLTLVKWSLSVRDDMSVYVERVVLAGPVNILR